ncbi:1-deoxy-D-xylulose-5-phosphate synthase [Kordiimonas marina]|uniref:1-deoxy-D-xylulose-5-phosphate synthase n=1 Tax=Kordiimonas marina TaxID=2872312 RepID=UPI001FF59C42|nr:1-deoxy-D-xylulose-5-phosphate synthase [Kordiimonas marina]MCJ9430326.1 1-deoxy-D-xylulose-5-phosphate synthase [Kordiimonas marina]
MYKNYRLVREIMDPAYVKSIGADTLPDFCAELRQELIEIISKTGGHIGVNLGVIELTTALYHVFDFPEDSLVWDIGHQVYVQKMLTERLPLLREIRVNGGAPGYAFRPESPYEAVTSSHAGAALSLALGAAKAFELQGKSNISVAVIGDGSFVEGSNQEALNHLAVDKGRLLYVLNDNEMALDENFGGWHEHFKKITRDPNAANIFKELGLRYEGPIDGHDIGALIAKLNEIKDTLEGPTVLHVKTVKGKGLETMAEKSPVRIHWNFPFDTGTLENTEGPKSKSHAAVFAETMHEVLEEDKDVFVVTPATLQNTGIYGLSRKYPERVLDVGMAEQHAVTFGGGLALRGVKPIVCFEATFLQLTYDQIVHDLCISDLPVMMVAARSGHTGLDHVTHHAMLDLSYLRAVPNLRIVYPATQADLAECVKTEVANLAHPTLVLFPYGGIIDDPDGDVVIDRKLAGFTPSADTLILSVGMQNRYGQLAQAALEKDHGIKADHICLTEVSDLNEAIVALLPQYGHVVTLEENVLPGGIGAAVLEACNALEGTAPAVQRFGFPKQFIEHGTRDYIYRQYGLDTDSVCAKIAKTLKG